jgi:hypothetical protein
MRLSRAISAGVVGCAIVVALVWLGGQIDHTDADLPALAASIVFGDTGTAAWIGGLVTQLIIATVAAFVYAGVFEFVTERANVWLGLAIAVPHVIVAGLVVGFLPASRMIEGGVTPPGAFFEYRGLWCVVAFIVAHLAFGAVVGLLYAPTRHAYPRAHRRWSEAPRSVS